MNLPCLPPPEATSDAQTAWKLSGRPMRKWSSSGTGASERERGREGEVPWRSGSLTFTLVKSDGAGCDFN